MKNLLRPILAILALSLVALGCSSCSPQAKKAGHLERADRYFTAGQYDKAEIEYMNVLQIEPLNAQAIGRLGVIYFDQGRVGKVLPFLLKGRELQPENLDLRIKLGQINLSAGRLKEARDEATFVLKRKPQDEEAPLLLTDASQRPEEIEAARQLLNGLPPPAPAGAPVQAALGSLEVRQRRFKEAETAFRHAQSLDPNSSIVAAALGVFYQMQRDLPQAEQAFKKASELAPLRSPRRLLYPRFKLQGGDTASARRLLEEISQKTPDYLPALILLAEIAAVEKKYPESTALVARILAIDSVHPEALLLSARLKLAQGEKEAAVTQMERMAKQYPQSPQVHYQLGLAYQANGDAGKAVASLNQAVTLAPGLAEAVLLLAEINLRKGDARSAIAVLKPFTQQRPEVVQARFLLADAYRMQGDLPEAISIYRVLEEQLPRSPQPPYWRGTALLQQGQRENAVLAFAKALTLAPDFVPALDQLVALDLAAKDFQSAHRRVDEKIASYPTLPGLYLLQAKVALVQKDQAQAEAALRKAIELQPDSPAPYLLLARLYANSQQLDKALANSQAVLAKYPNNLEALMVAGAIQNQKEDWNGARASYEKLLAVNPRFLPALNNLAYLYSEQFNLLDKAQEMAQKALELFPHEPHTADTLGWILYKKHQYPWALSLLQESAIKLPDAAEIQFHLGMTHYVLGDEAAARTALQLAVQLDQNFPGKEEALKRLAVLGVEARGAGTGARELLEKAVAERPDDPVALSRLAAIYVQAGDPDKAVATIEKALRANPSNVTVMMDLIRLLVARGEIVKALELAKTARKLAPDDPQVMHALGRLAWLNSDYPWAWSLLQESARSLPDDPELLFDLAEAAYSVGRVPEAETAVRRVASQGGRFARLDEARQFLELLDLAANPAPPASAEALVDQILKAKPNYVPALVARAAIFQRRSATAPAQEAYGKVVDLYPDFTPAKRELVVLYAENPAGNNPKIYDMALKARQAFPDDLALAKAMGILLYVRSDYAKAASLLNESVRKSGDDATLMYYLGMTQLRLKQPAESKKSLQRALDLNLRPDLAAAARRTLTEIP